MAFIKEESEDIKIEETFTIKQEETEEQTGLIEENKETEELIEAGEKHQVKTEEISWSSSLKNDNIGFTCSHCGKSFSCKQNLDLDIIFHRGGKPYACDECKKIFTIKGNRTEHMKIHTAEKPHTCGRCGKCFPQKQNIRKSTLWQGCTNVINVARVSHIN
ncbi:zinc finger protein 679-like [Onychostoma macrolepis]|uniref:zinc finger protein 679-like n=1 Tax=Onychostoma macrolepis TaxID=369639 RepID=UPI00272A2F60|nr:zinc finger protein 679-like [Onychostoma macrolepis]XP_058627169.1 zinc finger protein 679-like [Onychostoma macrolepis]XP_058627170.1 zinc finger protein 679-like [Onychostoma macrolepis]XP_058627172.1 zinc finger protein 679-like [Onychostoma macrolepis]